MNGAILLRSSDIRIFQKARPLLYFTAGGILSSSPPGPDGTELLSITGLDSDISLFS
jgi:hypothetical protein